ncbi:MAG TPA: hypothetical protein VEQ35_06840 [Beijerinckia sp.]|jgi:hypothetical protein|nr:hypothetical protein [Beijerinckia sp.]
MEDVLFENILGDATAVLRDTLKKAFDGGFAQGRESIRSDLLAFLGRNEGYAKSDSAPILARKSQNNINDEKKPIEKGGGYTKSHSTPILASVPQYNDIDDEMKLIERGYELTRILTR